MTLLASPLQSIESAVIMAAGGLLRRHLGPSPAQGRAVRPPEGAGSQVPPNSCGPPPASTRRRAQRNPAWRRRSRGPGRLCGDPGRRCAPRGGSEPAINHQDRLERALRQPRSCGNDAPWKPVWRWLPVSAAPLRSLACSAPCGDHGSLERHQRRRFREPGNRCRADRCRAGGHRCRDRRRGAAVLVYNYFCVA